MARVAVAAEAVAVPFRVIHGYHHQMPRALSWRNVAAEKMWGGQRGLIGRRAHGPVTVALHNNWDDVMHRKAVAANQFDIKFATCR